MCLFPPFKEVQAVFVYMSDPLPPSFQSGCAKAGGVRFSEEPTSTGAPSHVHFDEKLHDSVVMVTPEDDGNFMVKVCVTSQLHDR